MNKLLALITTMLVLSLPQQSLSGPGGDYNAPSEKGLEQANEKSAFKREDGQGHPGKAKGHHKEDASTDPDSEDTEEPGRTLGTEGVE